ncbi:hypothetical protein jhhlp_004046 [Lomentospora prolificans]|uniref:DNA/RNA-binding domain-containing protein n=1 Tax=Lomentospora prolificans TaxID=41688 RepID=A0A2N3NAJ0_9PEZI|nr:hypothetical protein jhhlp_004046 [Lomentospora prolificans]
MDTLPLDRKVQLYKQSRTGREQDPIQCILCDASVAKGLEPYTEHFNASHADVLEEEVKLANRRPDIARKYYRRSQNRLDLGQKYSGPGRNFAQPSVSSPPDNNRSSPASQLKATVSDVPATPASPPISSVSKASARPNRGSPVASSYGQTRRSRAQPTPTPDNEFSRPKYPDAGLWTGNNSRPPHKSIVRSTPGQLLPSPSPKSHPHHENLDNSLTHTMQREPDTRPISQQQLVAEVKGIYTGLVMVESKCIEVDTAQAEDSAKELNNEQWQALIALHRALLHEHHDFFLASQHPSASPALKRLASKYSMPARMWRHGIHSFLELLRRRLPGSLQHMLAYIYLAYNMMALLYETVPDYKETWIECLGDLGRYRMAIEDESVQDRDTWTVVSRHWYSKASDLSPTTGRLYHHLAILARPNWLRQLFYYTKSLCVSIPFLSARESILTLFEPVLAEPGNQVYELQEPLDTAFVQAHACMFLGQRQEQWRISSDKFLGLLDNQIARTARLFLEPAYYIGIANSCALAEYGSKSGLLYDMINPMPTSKSDDQENGIKAKPEGEDIAMKGVERQEADKLLQQSTAEFRQARDLFCDTARLIFQRLGDSNVWPFVHVTMVFIHHLAFFQDGMRHIEHSFPWKPFVDLLNTLKEGSTKYEQSEFPGLDDAEPARPLPEDFAMRGLLWANKYHVDKWFDNTEVDDEDKYFEVASFSEQRKDRILWLGYHIAQRHKKWILYDSEVQIFSVASEFDDKTTVGVDIEMDDAMEAGTQTPTRKSTTVDLQPLDIKTGDLDQQLQGQRRDVKR